MLRGSEYPPPIVNIDAAINVNNAFLFIINFPLAAYQRFPVM